MYLTLRRDTTVLKVHNSKLCDVSASCLNWQNIALGKNGTAGSIPFRVKWRDKLDGVVFILKHPHSAYFFAMPLTSSVYHRR